MNHKNMYKETFQVIRPSEELKEKILTMENGATGRKNGYVKRFSGMAAAIAVVVLLVGTASFAAANHTVRNWLITQWEQITGQSPSPGQEAEIMRLSQQVDQSVTLGDITVTLDSFTVSGGHFWILSKVSGETFDPADFYFVASVNFVNSNNPDLHLSVSGSTGGNRIIDDNGYTSLHGFAASQDQEIDLSDGTWIMHIKWSKHMDFYQNGSWVLEDEDPGWEFEVPISPVAEDPEQNVVLESVTVTVTAVKRLTGEEKEVVLEDIRITSVGMTCRIIGGDEEISIDDFPVIILKDGIRIEANSMSLDGDTGQKECQAAFQWDVPVDLKDATVVRIGETEIAIH